MRKITIENIEMFENYLICEEKSKSTIEKYVRDVSVFSELVKAKEISKEAVLDYKAELMEKYAPRTVNSIISSLNSFFSWMGWYDLRVKALKIQRQIFSEKNNELSKIEYERLLVAAKNIKNERLYYLMQTICATGIRVSELRFITVNSVKEGYATINCKGKIRKAFLPRKLCEILLLYINKEKIKNGPVFVSKNGTPLDRSNIWLEMKRLCEFAGVSKEKVFPHNLRHLFARTFYSMQKDIVRLADVLGHSSIETTRIYTVETGDAHRNMIEKMCLIRY